MQNVRMKSNPRLPWQKWHSTSKKLFINKLNLNVRKKPVKCYIWNRFVWCWNLWHFWKLFRNHLAVLKYIVEEEQRW